MTELECLREQIKALEKLVTIKDQIISTLQSRPNHYPYYYGGPFWTITSTSGATQGNGYQLGSNQNYSGVFQSSVSSIGGSKS